MITDALRAVHRWWLMLHAWELAHWLRDCQRSGIEDGNNLREIRGQLRELEIRIALLQPRRQIGWHN